jgi:archaellum biogenesis ATPase FlaH
VTVDNDTFARMGKSYQEKVVQALICDHAFAEQMADVIRPEFFDLQYLKDVVGKLYEHKRTYKTYPSIDVIEIMTTRDDPSDGVVVPQIKAFLQRVQENPLNGDTGYVQASSLDFCKRQTLKDAMVKAIEKMEESDYDSIQTIIKDALTKGASRDLGHEYMEGFSDRGSRSKRQPLPTGWPILDKQFNGGWERGTLTTFIAPTGAGKSMYLVNCGAAGVANGYNVLYVTCEMADYKIGLRFDSYYSGVEINSVSTQQEHVEQQARSKVKGRLFIKEFPTKTASVQTIRSYIQRLHATKEFKPDIVVVDYADLLRSTKGYGDKRFELEGIYEELRALAQELNAVVITADQTNRSGLDMEIVTIGQIGESYAKATVCDVIMTVSRRMEDKQSNTGRLFLAKSRLGADGVVFPFILNPATVKVQLLNAGEDPIALFMENQKTMQQKVGERWAKLNGNGAKSE